MRYKKINGRPLIIFVLCFFSMSFLIKLEAATPSGGDIKKKIMEKCEVIISMDGAGVSGNGDTSDRTGTVILEEDQVYRWKFDIPKTEQHLAKAIREIFGISGKVSIGAGSDITGEWDILDWRADWLRKREVLQSTTFEGRAPVLEYSFSEPSDPRSVMVVLKSKFSFTFTPSNGRTTRPINVSLWGRRIHLITDKTSPTGPWMAPPLLSGITGKKLSEFNAAIQQDGVAGGYPPNPDEIVFSCVDNNPNEMFTDVVQGARHDPAKIRAWVFVESFMRKYQKSSVAGKTRDPWKLDETLGEIPVEPDGRGKFVWLDPVEIGPAAGLGTYRVVRPREKADSPERYIEFYVPLKELEERFARTGRHDSSGEELKNLDSTENPNEVEDSGTPSGKIDWKRMPFGLSVNAGFIPPPGTESRPAEFRDSLRITVAFSDSSGNWHIPDPSLFENDPEAFIMFTKAVGIDPAEASPERIPSITFHTSCWPVRIYDDRRPNPVLIMTNTETQMTYQFTIPNSDLAADPYGNNDEEWIFTYDGSGPTMEKLSPGERQRLADALKVNEDVRLIFKILGYDNINRDIVAEVSGSPSHGILTPVLGEDNPDLIRYSTWKIEDPTVSNRNLIYEDPEAEIYKYPDYNFKNPKAEKEYAVEFTIHDGSLYKHPEMCQPDYPANPNPETMMGMTNSRKLRLVFAVGATSTQMRKVSGYDSIKSERPSEPTGSSH